MSFLQKFRESQNNIAQGIFHGLGHDASSYCQIETVLDDTTFVLSDGGLMSMLEVHGMRAMAGEEEAFKVVENFQKQISTAFRNAIQSVSVIFERDDASTMDDIRQMYLPTFATAKRLRLEIEDVLEGDMGRIAEFATSERCFIVVTTYPQTLAKADYKEAVKEQRKMMNDTKLPIMSQAQNPLKPITQIINAHKSLVESLLPGTGESLLNISSLDVDQAALRIRFCIDREFTSPNWRPSLPGGHANTPAPKTGKSKGGFCPYPRIAPSALGDGSHWLPPLLGTQLVPRDLHIGGQSRYTVRIGERYYAPLVMDAGPQIPEDFLSLFRRIKREVPWRLVINLTPNGLSSLKFAKIFTGIFGFMGENNKRIRAAITGLEDLQADGESVVGFQVNAMTWADNEKTLSKNAALLSRSLQAWGSCEITDSVGDPALSFFSAIPGFTNRNPAPTMAAPLSEIATMLPLNRPASPWPEGALIYRTPDGKLYPVQPVSPMQDTFNLLIYAPPGSGKSVTMNSENLAFCLSPGLTKLPLMVILDIGPSSSGLISMLQDALPDDQKHQVGYFKLRNSRDCAINIFASQLGCRFPSPRERSMQVNFLTLLATPIGSSRPYNMAGELAGLLVDELYMMFSDKNRPKLYEPHIDPVVDKGIAECDVSINDGTTWWQIVDALFDKGAHHAAARAQDYALPTVSDLMIALGSQSVNDMFNRDDGSAVDAGNGQRLVDALATVISSSLREYPVLNGATQFDVGAARVISLDLNEVASGDDPGSKRRSAIMYFLGYSYAARNFFIDDDVLKNCGERYRAYHKARIVETKEDKKAIIMDEFHKTGGLDALRAEIVTNMREGRKWNVRVVLASQLLEDFSDEMIKLLSALYIIKAPNQSDVDTAQHLFSLSDVAAKRISNELTGPTAAGAPFLAIYQTKKGRYSQILVNTIGPTKRWALSTTAEDMSLRNRLYALLGGKAARKLLTERFPSGTAMAEIDRRRAGLGDDAQEGVVESLANDLIREWTDRRALQ